MDENKLNLKIWDTHFGPDPLEGRVRSLTIVPEINKTPKFTSPVTKTRPDCFYPFKSSPTKSTPSPYIHGQPLTQARSVVNLNQCVFQLQQMIHVVMPCRQQQQQQTPVGLTRRQSFPLSGAEVFCSYCKSSGEDKQQYTSHSTKNCPILQNCICDYCGAKGHTTSHCYYNTSGSVFQRLRKSDEGGYEL